MEFYKTFQKDEGKLIKFIKVFYIIKVNNFLLTQGSTRYLSQTKRLSQEIDC